MMAKSSTSFVPDDPRLIGNQNSVGNGGGQPSPYDRDKVFADLIEWARKDDSLNFNKFCAMYDPPFGVRRLHEWCKNHPEYTLAYETAKAFLGFRREEKLSEGSLHVKCYDLNATVYDLAHKDEEADKANAEAKRKKDILQDNTDYVVEIMNYAKDKKIDESKDNNNPPAQV